MVEASPVLQGQCIAENSKVTVPPKPPESEFEIKAFEQNHETFRSLNHQMWQIPLISMTLTGGLWFGVSRVDGQPLFQIALLLMATIGNAALFLVIQRLRYVMERTLTWIEKRSGDNFVSAKGDCWYNRPLVVRRSFQALLGLASLTSLGLLVITWLQTDWSEVVVSMQEDPSISYYDRHARDLADSYEGISASSAHPGLEQLLKERFPAGELDVLDIGAGTGRDSAWLASLGHRVLAVEPSKSMLQIAQHAHKDASIKWMSDALPSLSVVRSQEQVYDVIVLSAVWMHLPPENRSEAIASIAALLKPDGLVYVTLRLGPSDAARSIHRVSLDELGEIAKSYDLKVEYFETRPDLLGRGSIEWQSVLLTRDQ